MEGHLAQAAVCHKAKWALTSVVCSGEGQDGCAASMIIF